MEEIKPGKNFERPNTHNIALGYVLECLGQVLGDKEGVSETTESVFGFKLAWRWINRYARRRRDQGLSRRNSLVEVPSCYIAGHRQCGAGRKPDGSQQDR